MRFARSKDAYAVGIVIRGKIAISFCIVWYIRNDGLLTNVAHCHNRIVDGCRRLKQIVP
jgi:hypothetical protein